MQQIEYGLEKTQNYLNPPDSPIPGKTLMTTRYCLRYELGMCLMGKNKPTAPHTAKPEQDKRHLLLHNNGKWFRLDFDCRNCQMLLSALPPQTKSSPFNE